MTKKEQLRRLPSVSDVLEHPDIVSLGRVQGEMLVKYAVRQTIEKARAGVLDGGEAPSIEDVIAATAAEVQGISSPSLKSVINATGIILHTNLGRAPLGQAVINEVANVGGGYSNVEFDIGKGCRGNRYAHVRDILKFLTSAEDVLVVNNNAAGILLALNTLALGKEVIVSRGELIEIGGSFRIPEIIVGSGPSMVEVGSTNKTHLTDYENAIGKDTAIIFKAHKSNYAIKGFTQEIGLQELSELAHKHNLPMMYDIGSGLLRKPECLYLEDEPDVAGAIADGADIVAFSCDKLLGGPQAGILAGKADLIARMAESPLMRTLRVGKLTLAALSAACRHYLRDDDLAKSNPTFMMLERKPDELKRLASALLDQMTSLGIKARILDSEGQCGGGTLPELKIPSFAVEVLEQDDIGSPGKSFAEIIFDRLLNSEQPVVAILREGKLLLDVLTLFEGDLHCIADAVGKGLGRGSGRAEG